MAHRAKKELGQNFLKSKLAISKIVEVASLSATDTVLEIGPGKGALTRALLDTGCTVIAIEKDGELIVLLQKTFAEEIASKKLTLIQGDIRTVDFSHYLLQATSYKLIANIPYYITGEILELFLEHGPQPERIVVLVQKEVAQRIVARDKKESILSLSVKAYGTPKIVMNVSKKYFSPAPKVDSAVLCISDISKKKFAGGDEKKFFTLVKAGFAHKRKQLVPNLASLVPKETLSRFLTEHGHSARERAEELSVDDWLALSQTTNPTL
ncbi:MAG: 16S rRNA (adenine(1518)-N(6)/adenine(1519)-N(6))-dimethyltransferase RsmA [Candidatus Campbellbacteria bacterium]|nr:16S rRNA (adenine(1518)-N(6)/adenine(1519)-N(6))-dimethyltransferase RsmA [Candidatus Campbellbacteria bacterium]